jgi:hypothetical protein
VSLSAVAGVITADQTVGRVIVGPLDNMPLHQGDGERVVVVPGYTVNEPVSREEAPGLIAKTRAYVRSQIANKCGDCQACCKTLYLEAAEFTKPSHTLCRHACGGCAIYDTRPKECRVFKCYWLLSQESDDPLPVRLRPDKCGAIFTHDTTDGKLDLIEMHLDGEGNPDAWAYVRGMEGRGFKVKRVTHYRGETTP